MVQVPNFTASGDIERSRFVAPSGSHTVAQAGVGSVPIGVSQRGTRDTPLPGASTLAAIAGSPVGVYGLGEMCHLEAGAAVAVNAFVKPDSVGSRRGDRRRRRLLRSSIEPCRSCRRNDRCVYRARHGTDSNRLACCCWIQSSRCGRADVQLTQYRLGC